MKKKSLIYLLLFLTVFFCSVRPSYCKENIITEVKCNASEYTVMFEQQKAMISRDGSEAVPIISGTKLTKPGTYFLTLIDNKGHIKINKFTILPAKETNSWTIARESELEEIFKYSLENFHKEITIKFNYGQFTINEICNIFDKYLTSVTNKYPKIVSEGYAVSSLLGSKPVVKIKFSYPLQVTNTLKNYDLKTNKIITKVINEKVTFEMQDYQRELTLYKFITDHISYSKTKDKGINYINATPMSHTMYGGLVDQIAVCDGYSRSLMYLLNATGVPTQFITGTSDGIPHAWNLVQIQGAYYHVDSTWADQESDKIGSIYEFFNESDDYMKKTHIWESKLYPKAVSNTYNTVNLQTEIVETYRVTKASDINNVLSSLAQKKPAKASIVFYNDSVNRWNQEEILGRIVNSLQTGIIYKTEKKYDCLVVSFNKD